METLQILNNKFLWLEKRKLVAHILLTNRLALSCDETENGRFRNDYFEPVKFPIIEQKAWGEKTCPIPPGMHDVIIDLIKQKVAAGVCEPSTSFYCSMWFSVAKKDGPPCIIHNLQQLNLLTIHDSAGMPYVESSAKQCAGTGIYSSLNLFVGFDHCTVHPQSQDCTTFSTPFGTFCLTSLPQVFTLSMQIFHTVVTFSLQDATVINHLLLTLTLYEFKFNFEFDLVFRDVQTFI